ncbi:MAG: DUF2069 domain-containing protein [Dokdonella sp.]
MGGSDVGDSETEAQPVGDGQYSLHGRKWFTSAVIGEMALTLPPLLLPLLALRSGAKRALLWIGIVSLGYFCHGVVAAWAIASMRWPAVIEVALCVLLIGTLGWITRSAKKR